MDNDHNQFMQEVIQLYKRLGFTISNKTIHSQLTHHFIIEQNLGGYFNQAIVTCIAGSISSNACDHILLAQSDIQKTHPTYQLIIVSTHSIITEIKNAMTRAGITCIAWHDLLCSVIPIKQYVTKWIVNVSQTKMFPLNEKNNYYSPSIQINDDESILLGIPWLTNWAKMQSGLLCLIGLTGAGKTTFIHHAAQQFAQIFLNTPFHTPAPLVISLRDYKKAIPLKDMIMNHFKTYQLFVLHFQLFEFLFDTGRVIVIIDGLEDWRSWLSYADMKAFFIDIINFLKANTQRMHCAKIVLSITPDMHQSLSNLYDKSIQETRLFLQPFNDDTIQNMLMYRPKGMQSHIQNWFNLQWDPAWLPRIPFNAQLLTQLRYQASSKYTPSSGLIIYLFMRKSLQTISVHSGMHEKLIKAILLELAWRMWRTQTMTLSRLKLKTLIQSVLIKKNQMWTESMIQKLVDAFGMTEWIRIHSNQMISFCHELFIDYWIAERVLMVLKSNHQRAICQVIGHQRLSNPIIHYLYNHTYDYHQLAKPLHRILQSDYKPIISENALLIIYWLSRMACHLVDSMTPIESIKGSCQKIMPDHMQLSGSMLQGVILPGIYLKGADLSESNLTDANLEYANLNHVNFSESIMDGIQMNHAEMDGAILSGASMSE